MFLIIFDSCFKASGIARGKSSLTRYPPGILAYLKNVKEKLGTDTEKIQAFEKGVNNYYKNHIKKNFSNFDFYIGASMNVETGM